MSSKTPKIYVYLFALLFAAYPVGVFGQSYGNFGGNITLTMTPEFPRAHEKISVEARGFSVDLNRADVSWLLNGVLQKKEVGSRTFSFTTGGLGETSSLTVIVDSLSQGSFRETLSIRPAEVDILWEATSYTPPFYKGKGLLSSKSPVTLTAMPSLVAPNGKTAAPESLVYTWEQDGKTLLSQSGFGKRSVTVEGPVLFQESIVSVEVSLLDESVKARKTIALSPVEPQVVFYEKHPLRGVLYGRAITDRYALTKDEFVLRAEPYFFPSTALPADISAGLQFGWRVNSQSVVPLKQNELVLRKETEESAGQSRVELTVKDFKKLLQAAAGLLIQF